MLQARLKVGMAGNIPPVKSLVTCTCKPQQHFSPLVTWRIVRGREESGVSPDGMRRTPCPAQHSQLPSVSCAITSDYLASRGCVCSPQLCESPGESTQLHSVSSFWTMSNCKLVSNSPLRMCFLHFCHLPLARFSTSFRHAAILGVC